MSFRCLLRVLVVASAAVAAASQAAAVSVVHITDVHIDPYYVEGAPAAGCYCETHDACPRMPASCAVLPLNDSNAAGPFGEPEADCATPLALWEGAMSFLAAEQARSPAAFAYFTGDFGEAGMSASCGPGSPAQAQITRNIAHAMAAVRTTLGVPVYGVLGNHDSSPGDVFDGSEAMAWLYQSLLASFGADFSADASALADLACCGWYSTPSPQAGLRIVALNTNYLSPLNPLLANASGPAALLGARQLAWLNATLAAAAAAGEAVHILGHIPPVGWAPGVYDAFRAALTVHRGVVSSLFFGHDHVDESIIVRECSPPPPPPPPPANGTIDWVVTRGVAWCSGGDWQCGDIFGAGLQGGDSWCPLLPAGAPAAEQVALCESACGNASVCAGFTYYPASPQSACCMRTSCASKPLDPASTAVCYEKPAPPAACASAGASAPLAMLFVGPSLTEGFPPSNPALRRYELAGAGARFVVADAVTSFANLTRANAAWALEFEPEYRMTTRYGLAAGTAGDGGAWQSLVERMAVDGSPSWADFYAAHSKLYVGSTPPCAAGACKAAILALVNGTF